MRIERVQENEHDHELIHYHTPPQYVKCLREQDEEFDTAGFILALKELIEPWRYSRSMDDKLDRARDDIQELLDNFGL